MARKYFLSVSNGRTGSSWLETSLGCLPDVAIDFEFKWKPSLYEPKPVHMVIADRSFSSRAALDGISADAPVVGSKLVLDRYGFLGPEIIDVLGEVIQREIAIIHLTRDYFSTLLSWRTREVFNALNDLADARLEGTRIKSGIKRTTVKHDSTLHPVRVVRGWLDWRLFAIENGESPLARMPATSGIPFEDIVDNLLAFFYNDLIGRELAHNAERSMFVRYGNIRSKFAQIAEFVGSQAGDEDIQAILANPVTKRIGGLTPELVRHAAAVQRVSRCLDDAMDDIVSTGKRLGDVWRWSPDGKSAEIKVHGLNAAVRRGKSLLSLPAFGPADVLVWPCEPLKLA